MIILSQAGNVTGWTGAIYGAATAAGALCLAAAIPLQARHTFCMVTASGQRDRGMDQREGETNRQMEREGDAERENEMVLPAGDGYS